MTNGSGKRRTAGHQQHIVRQALEELQMEYDAEAMTENLMNPRPWRHERREGEDQEHHGADESGLCDRRGGSNLRCLESDTEVSCFPKEVARPTMAKAKSVPKTSGQKLEQAKEEALEEREIELAEARPHLLPAGAAGRAPKEGSLGGQDQVCGVRGRVGAS